ncbi:MAG: S8 family serine peptidase, partial [Pelovirga sp.]
LSPIGILMVLCLCFTPVAAVAAVRISPELQATLAATAPGEPIAIIVTFAAAEKPAVLARRLGRDNRGTLIRELKARNERALGPVRQLLRRHDIGGLRPLWLVDGAAVSVPAEVIAELAALPGVATLSLDDTLEAPRVLAADAATPKWNILRTGAPLLWDLGYRGEGVTVAIIDSGINIEHPDLKERWRGLPGDWFDPYGECPTPCDASNSHGTSVAGVVAGGSAGGSAIGMAPGASLIAARIFREDVVTGEITANTSYIVQALQWALEPGGNSDGAPAVVNNSWGFDAVGECSEPLTLRDAIKTLKAAGIAVIASAGNSGGTEGDYFTSVSPANYPESLAVGATDSNNQVPHFSARGPSACPGDDTFPDLVAPGFGIRVATAAQGYLTGAGTSFAAPHVAGAMALLFQAQPGIRLDTLEAALQQSATDVAEPGIDDDSGYGLLNVKAAYDLLGAAPPAIAQLTIEPQQLDFGQVPPGDAHAVPLDLINSGTAPLTLAIDPGRLAAPFTLAGTNCPTSLAPGDLCTLSFSFAPEQAGTFTGEVVVASSDPVNPAVVVPLTGTGNTAPGQPQLLSPADKALLPLGDRVILSWTPATDADGDAVQHSLLLANNPLFFEPQIFRTFSALALPLLLGGLCITATSGRRKKIALVPLALVVLWLSSCGGGGGGDNDTGSTIAGDPADDTTAMRQTLDGLTAGTYYWKVLAEDDRGGSSESRVRSFTVE